MPSPSRPDFLSPSPCRPRSALYSGLNRKCTSVLCCSLDSIQISPPRPPSPPEGPPRGTNFSRRNAMQPLPPSPAFTRIFASSMNIWSREKQLRNETQPACEPKHLDSRLRLLSLPDSAGPFEIAPLDHLSVLGITFCFLRIP